MNLQKGILRIIAIGLWLFLGAWFAFSLVLPLFAPEHKWRDISVCLIVFIGLFGFPVVTIIRISDRISPADRQFLELDDLCTKAAVVIAIIAGVTGLSIYSHFVPTGPHPAPYVSALITPFMLVFGSYIIVRRIVEGFRD